MKIISEQEYKKCKLCEMEKPVMAFNEHYDSGICQHCELNEYLKDKFGINT